MGNGKDINQKYSLHCMESELIAAFNSNQLTVFYQPQIDIRSGAVVGIEALLRWNHPEWGMIAPDELIPVAESTGLIFPIGEWVLRTACVQNKALQVKGHSPMVVSVNLSVLQFKQSDIVQMVADVLDGTGLSAGYLNLEITESMALDVDRTLTTLQELKELGVSISMDDFGKGYSSLSYLKRFPLDTLKIDQSFIRDCTLDSNDATIVKAIISMAHNLNFNVIAEGVETREQLIFLQQHLCDEAQGYLFSEPLPIHELEQKLHELPNVLKRHGLETDLTSQAWLEEKLRVARQDLEDTVRQQQGMTMKIKKQDGRFIHTLCDGELLYRMGSVPGQIIGKELFDFLPKAQAEDKTRYYERAWQGEEVTYESESRNGIWYMASLRPIRRAGRVVELIASCVDITERKQAEEELKTTKDQLESFIDNNPDAICIIDLQKNVLRINKTFENMFGWTSSELLGRPLPYFANGTENDFHRITERLMNGEAICDYETVRLRKDGTPVHITVSASAVRDAKGSVVAMAGMLRDITERKKTEELLRKADKLNVVGHLAAGVAHEIRNPLTTLRGFLQLLRGGHREKDKFYDLMLSELDRINTILGELLIIAKPQVTRFERKDLPQMLKDVLKLLMPQVIMQGVQTRAVFDVKELPLFCSETELKQVFINIIKNAIEAMPHGGYITVKLRLTENDRVTVRIADQGIGIAEDRIPKLGEPFFTTKERGTGLGLMMCYKIIEAHRGSMSISSKEGVGTTVDVVLPLHWEHPDPTSE